jgi:hypothetical protein
VIRRSALPLIAVLCLTACGGGGGGGGGPTTPNNPTDPVTRGITFTASGAPGAASISLRSASSGSGNLLLEVVATGVDNLYGVAFDLTFPANALAFVGATEGSFLAGSGQTTLQVAANGARLIVGASRLGPLGGVDGTGVLMTLEFRSLANGGGAIGFDAERAIDPLGSDLSLVWQGGQVTVTV